MNFLFYNLQLSVEIMSLSIKLEIIKGHGTPGDRVCRVIFRGELELMTSSIVVNVERKLY